MKRIPLIFLAILYVGISVGFTSYSHLCEGILQEITLTENHGEQSENCTHCDANNSSSKNNECCKHELKIVKIEEKAQLLKQLNIKFKWNGDALPHRFFGHVFEGISPNILKHPRPPLTSLPLLRYPLYTLFCVFRI